ncbi:hypothetical protein C162_15530 [Paenibacillus sp. FSL R7-269]|uniref:DUF4179 domain-containing protein n=1 Tax=Paenibacillus sp. FSL R7-269 TaxID=1226755 RepID=UPI0003E1DCD9|nr:DUF4179 domain-containing protein [Paenibacillus sp. FSL R7-269]ETT48293.1 hypothetical protein C162_15530 [Paenibacillus sp. FSL R7-269]
MTTAKDRLDVESEAVIVQLQKEAEHMIHSMPSSVHFDELWQLHTGGVKQAPRGRHQLSSYKKWIISVTAALTVTAGSIIGIGFISPTVAEALRVIPFFDYLYAKGVYTANLKVIEQKQLSSPVGLEAKDRGITFEMAEVYYDGVQLVLNYEVTYPASSPPISEKDAEVYYELHLRGHEPQSIYTHDFTITGDHTFVGTTRQSFGDKDLPGQLTLDMTINAIGVTKGNWDLTIPLDASKSAALTSTVYPKDLNFTYKKSLYTLEKLTLGPVNTQVIVRNLYPRDQLNVILQDDIGTLYTDQGGGATNDYYYFNFSPLTVLNPKPAHVTLIVIEPLENGAVKQTEDRQRLNGSFPITLKGNEGGTVKVTSIDYEEKQTVVYYEASQVMSQITSLYLEEKQGHPIFPKGQPVRISRDKLAFKLIFPPVQSSDKLEIMARYFSYPEDIQQFRLRIPVQWTP